MRVYQVATVGKDRVAAGHGQWGKRSTAKCHGQIGRKIVKPEAEPGDVLPGILDTDVTQQAGIFAPAYGMGVATGDFDNDGYVDLYISNFGPNQLLHNNGDGTFSVVTAAAGVGDPAWSVSSSFVGYDGAVLLDIYVCQFVDYTLAGTKPLRSPADNRG